MPRIPTSGSGDSRALALCGEGASFADDRHFTLNTESNMGLKISGMKILATQRRFRLWIGRGS